MFGKFIALLLFSSNLTRNVKILQVELEHISKELAK